ncbi:restriction endonuclease subunit S [Candidatus Saccharibacteria bacterium]|nr:restriction endonuclease subunit S [Candidatus Saccharibacteria bacterium]
MNKWQTKRLGSVATIARGGSPRPIDDYILPIAADGYNWLKIGDVNPDAKYITSVSSKIKEEGLKKTRLVKAGDFILSNSMSFGRPYITKIDTCIHDGWLTIGEISSELSKEYLYYMLTTESIQAKLASLSAGSGVLNLKKETVAGVMIDLPPIDEQEAIVSALSDCDESIGSQSAEIVRITELKKGLMQQILSGNLRFKDSDDNDFPAWKDKELGDVTRLQSGYAFKSSAYSEDGDYKVLTIANVQSGKLNIDKINSVKEMPKDIRPQQILSYGDILISMTGNVGRVCLVDVKNCLLNQRVGKIICEDEVSKEYIYMLVSSPQFMSRMENKAQGGAQGNLSTGDILGYEFSLPVLREQQRIATFFSNLDLQIDALKSLRDETVKQKKWLLNNLVTGKIRLPKFNKEGEGNE